MMGKTLFLLLLNLLAAEAQASSTCEKLFFWRKPQFDNEHFLERKAAYRKALEATNRQKLKDDAWRALENGDIHKFKTAAQKAMAAAHDLQKLKDEAQPRSLEEKVAFLEALLEKSGAAAPGNPPTPSRWNLLGRWRAKSFQRTAGHLDFNRGITDLDMDSMIENYYAANFGDPVTIRKWLTQETSLTIKKMLEQRLEKELASKGVEDAFRSLTLLRARKGIRERAFGLFHDHPNISFVMQTLGSTTNFLNTGAVGLPFGSPSIGALNKKLLTPALLKIVETQGADAVKPLLYAQFSDRTKAELYYKLFFKAYNVLAWGALLYDSIMNQGDTEEKKGTKVTPEMADETEFRSRMLKKWMEEFNKENNRAPTDEEVTRITIILKIIPIEKKQ